MKWETKVENNKNEKMISKLSPETDIFVWLRGPCMQMRYPCLKHLWGKTKHIYSRNKLEEKESTFLAIDLLRQPALPRM